MFIKKEEIIEKVDEIISEGHDNEIVFIVASKGVGKTKLLQKIYDIESQKKDIIIVDGNRIRNSSSILTRCFIDGICSYIEMNDTENRLNELVVYLSTLLKSNIIVDVKRINIEYITYLLSNLSLPLLKDVFIQIAGDTPLVIISKSIFFNPIDVDYLNSLKFDNWCAKITFIIAIRPTLDCIKTLDVVIKNNENRIWLFPLLPEIITNSNSLHLKSIATIHLENIGNSNERFFKEKLLSTDAYFDTYNMVNKLLANNFSPSHLFFIANQEIRLCDNIYIEDIVRKIYNNNDNIFESETNLLLPHNGKLLWIDSLSYFLIIYDGGISKAIIETQKFFLNIIKNSEKFSFCCPERMSLVYLLNEASLKKNNKLADGFSNYFSSFASLCKMLSIKKRKQNFKKIPDIILLDSLEKLILDFTNSSMDALLKIYDETQLCSVLDIGLDIITHYATMSTTTEIDCDLKKIVDFKNKCTCEAKKWHDETLLKKIIKIEEKLTKFNNNNYNYDIIYNDSTITKEIIDIDNIIKLNIYNEKTLCEKVLKTLSIILENINYRSLKENDLNDVMRDCLSMFYVFIKDQTRIGTSGTGLRVGNVDLLICNNAGISFAIIEPLCLKSLNKATINDHIIRTILNYNPMGCKICLSVIYSYVKDFAKFWDKMLLYISEYQYPFHVAEDVADDDTGLVNLRHAKVTFYRSGQSISHHFYAINLYEKTVNN